MNHSENKGQILVYATEDGQLKLDVRLHDETVWLSLDQLATLFQRDKSTISRHIKNVFEEKELMPDSVVANFATTAADGKNYQVDYFNLDMIISVGYRVKSAVATRFRIWATQRLREYIVKGFLLDDERLKNPDLPFDYLTIQIKIPLKYYQNTSPLILRNGIAPLEFYFASNIIIAFPNE